MSSNERIGSALNSTNLKSDETHFDTDYIASLALANKLGRKLQHLKSGGYDEELYPAIIELAKVLRKSCNRKKIGLSKDNALLISKQALKEWLIKICRNCNGTGQLQPLYSAEEFQGGECSHCQGTGIFKPVWKWRKSQMKLESGDSEWWDKRIELGKEICEDAYRSAQTKVKVMTTNL